MSAIDRVIFYLLIGRSFFLALPFLKLREGDDGISFSEMRRRRRRIPERRKKKEKLRDERRTNENFDREKCRSIFKTLPAKNSELFFYLETSETAGAVSLLLHARGARAFRHTERREIALRSAKTINNEDGQAPDEREHPLLLLAVADEFPSPPLLVVSIVAHDGRRRLPTASQEAALLRLCCGQGSPLCSGTGSVRDSTLLSYRSIKGKAAADRTSARR